MPYILVPNDKGEVACPSCHKIALASTWKTNRGYCPANNCTQYAHVWDLASEKGESLLMRQALKNGYQVR